MAATPTVFSVPLRRPCWWPQPNRSGGSSTPSRTKRAPTPFGAWNLWPERLSRSQGTSPTSIGSLPMTATASQWKRTPRRLQRDAISRTGWQTPVSLLAHMTDTRKVSSRRASSTSRSCTAPSSPGCTRVRSKPWRSSSRAALSTDLCSTALTTRCPARRSRAEAKRAQLFDSVPPPVKKISRGAAPRAAASPARASSTMRPALWPAGCGAAELPNSSSESSRHRAWTRGCRGVDPL